MSAGTFATAFSQTPAQFAVLQMATRVFMLMGAALALVILVEEFPADRRGAGIGLLSVLGGMGFGLGAGLYALVDWLPFGWRALYALGVLPVLLLPFFRRSLRETRRFEAGRRSRDAEPPSSAWRRWVRPVAMLARTHPRRAVSVGMAGMLAAMGAIAFFQYTSYFVRNVHGWSPGQYSLLVLTGGLLGLCGNVLGGRASDRFGRRRVGFLALALAPAGVAFFYGGPASTLALAWGLTTLCATSGDLVLRALATELFPTSHRSAAAGWLILVQTLGWVSGLFVVGAATGELADLGPVVMAVSLANVAAALCVWLVPETSGLELETIAAEERR
jgi:MFS family permease